MAPIRVLAFSSSRFQQSAYLETAAPVINDFLGHDPLSIAFIPFAAADSNYDEYVGKVKQGLAHLPHTVNVVKPEGAVQLIGQAEVIMVGGGNTFKLLHHVYEYGLLDLMKQKVYAGAPYIGWSAGSNIAGPTIGTTNDMPIIEPKSFKALGFFPFQINPHYINVKPEGHHGETRDERLAEFLKVNPKSSIVGLPEGTALQLEGNTLTLKGQAAATLFRSQGGPDPTRTAINVGSDISWLL
jgi:dipeptidase E